MEVQIFGVKKSADTRKALRFFSERRIKTHFVDLVERAASPGELTRFVQKFGVAALIDEEIRETDEMWSISRYTLTAQVPRREAQKKTPASRWGPCA